jgi:polar amino acid transport system substrate-binding protein
MSRRRCHWAVAFILVAMILGAQGSAPLLVRSAELNEIVQRGHLIVAVKDNWQPLGFRQDDGELTGLEIDIAHRLAAQLLGDAAAVKFVPVANTERLPALLNGEVDLVIAGTTVTEGRSRLVSFSTPYYLDGTAFVTASDEIQKIADLAHHPVAILNGSSAIARVQSHLPQGRFIGVNSYTEALALLEAGEAIAFAGEASVLAGWVQNYPHYRLLPTVLSADALAIAMPKGNQYDPLRRQVNAAIESWYQDGWLGERIDYWGLPR